MRRWMIFAVALSLAGTTLLAQTLAGTLIGTVQDAQGGVLPGVVVRVSSPALIGGAATTLTSEIGQLRFPSLPPGVYALEIEAPRLNPYRERDIAVGVGATLERTIVLAIAGVEQSVVVDGTGSRIEARGSGFETRFGPDDLKPIPVRRFSMFDFIRAAPGIPATSPGSVTTNSIPHLVRARTRTRF